MNSSPPHVREQHGFTISGINLLKIGPFLYYIIEGVQFNQVEKSADSAIKMDQTLCHNRAYLH